MFTNEGWESKFEEFIDIIQTIYKAFISALSAPAAETGERIRHKSKIFPISPSSAIWSRNQRDQVYTKDVF